jgi:spoIIIJ-associated protein
MPQDVEKRVCGFINQILELGGFDLKATPEPTECFKVQVRGRDVALLLARNAELLDALEYLGNRICARRPETKSKIIFDCGNYRARREKELRLMAEKAAERVCATRIPFSFDPLSPNERRIIHLALASNKAVRTESQGEGFDRKVVIYPV